MNAFSNIFRSESGLSVRQKLNQVFAELITGSEGINAIWEAIRALQRTIPINITINSQGQHIWEVGENKYLLTPYTEAATVVSTSYAAPVVKTISYNTAVSNEGEGAGVTALTFTQVVTKTWSDGTTTTETLQGNKSTTGASFTYALSDALNGATIDNNGEVSANPSTSASSVVIGKVTPQVTWHGETSNNTTIKASVSQAAATFRFAINGMKTYRRNVGAAASDFTLVIEKSSGVTPGNIIAPMGVVASLSGTVLSVSVDANVNTTARSFTVSIGSNVGSLTLTINQEAAAEVVITSTDYGTPTILSIAYSGNVTNEGGAASVQTLTFSQVLTYHWSDGHTTTETKNGNLNTAGASFTYNLTSAANGATINSAGRVTANPSTSASSQLIGIVTPQVTWNGKTSSNTAIKANINQSAAVCKFSNGTMGYSKTVGADSSSFTLAITKSSGVVISNVSSSSSGAQAYMNGNNLVVDVSANPSTSSQRTITITVTTNIGNMTVTVTQAAAELRVYFGAGQTNNSLSGFQGLEDSTIVALATSLEVGAGTIATGSVAGVSVADCYEHTISITSGNNIFFVLIPDNVQIKAAKLVTGVLDSEFSEADIKNTTTGWRATHTNVVVDGVSHHVYGYRASSLGGNTMKVYVKINS